MESKPFYHIHLLITVENLPEQIELPDDLYYSFLFDTSTIENVNDTFEYIFSGTWHHPFSITIQLNDEGNDTISRQWINKLYLLLSHPKYIRIENKLIIAFIGGRGSYQQQVFFRQLNLELSRQYFETIFVNLNTTPELSSSFYYFNENNFSPGQFSQWYISKLKATSNRLNLFFKDIPELQIKTIVATINEAEAKLKQETPVLYNLIDKQISSFEKEKQLELRIEQLNNELISKNAYLDFLSGKNADGTFNGGPGMNATMKIKKFYHSEYEILPLWYKRLGHVIKVLMGKRTFKSLFDKNVPKYKE